MPKQVFVGITGGIGSGKTFVSGILKHLGFPVYNSDTRAKYLTENSPEILKGLEKRFGKEVFAGAVLDRKALGSVVFADPKALEDLNQIIHPVVARDFKSWQAAQSSQICFKEAAILFEIGAYKALDFNVLVRASEAQRIARIMSRDGISEEEIRNRMDRQWPDKQKAELADFVIENNKESLLIPQIEKLLNELKGRS